MDMRRHRAPPTPHNRHPTTTNIPWTGNESRTSFLVFPIRITTLRAMSNSFDDMPFFDEEPGEAPRKQQAPVPPPSPKAGGLNLAPRANPTGSSWQRLDYLKGLNPEQTE